MATNKKIVLITGVGRAEGIGYGVAQAMSQQDFEVIITARALSKAEALAKQLSANGRGVLAEALDITTETSVGQLAEFVRHRYGQLDVLINNAGTGLDYGVHPLETDFAVTRATLETNLFGAWRMVQYFYPLLGKSEKPRIVNISSGAGAFGDPVFGLGVHPAVVTSYGISKLALNGLTVWYYLGGYAARQRPQRWFLPRSTAATLVNIMALGAVSDSRKECITRSS